jgi:erythromycin esterase
MDAPTVPARLSAEAVRLAAHPLRTLDPAAPLDDLDWLDAAIGDARVVAIGENAHYNAESYRLRHRLVRYLVERHGFGALAWESGFAEGWRTDRWLRGGNDRTGEVLAAGMTSLMGLWTEARSLLDWLRMHTTTIGEAGGRPVGWYGIDLSGSNVSLLPSLDAVLAYLAQADPELVVDPALRETAAAFAAPSAFSSATALAGYTELPAERRDALTSGLAELAARLDGRRRAYQAVTGAEGYRRAVRTLRLATTFDASVRALFKGDQASLAFNRDAAIADNVEWLLEREERVVLAAHNGHIQRWPATFLGMPPADTMGLHLADRLGPGYLAIGVTNGTGQTLNTDPTFFTGTLFTELPPPPAGTLDALMADTLTAASAPDGADGPFAVDLRRLPPADTEAVRAATRLRAGALTTEVDPIEGYDLLIHLPHVTAADPDPEAVAASPEDVRTAFAAWDVARRDVAMP